MALQGFGGGSGIVGLARAPRFLREHLDNPGFDLTSWSDIANGLVRWLDGHEPTACWADYHAAIRSALKVVAADFASLRTLAEAGTPLSVDAVDRLEGDLAAANRVPAPAGCQ